MHDLPEWDRLDIAAFRVSMGRSVRRFAWFLTAVGAIAGASGVAAAVVPLVAIGMVLAATGVWNLLRPSVTGLAVDGAVMVITGLFNCVAWMWLDDARASGLANWVFAGLFQIAWGVRRLALYRTARRTPHDPRAVARLEAIVRDLAKRRPKTHPNVVEFWTGSIRRHRSRIGFYDEGVVALLEHQVVRLEKRTDIWIEALGTTWLGRSIKVRIQLGDLHLIALMPIAHLERFEHWKMGQSRGHAIAA